MKQKKDFLVECNVCKHRLKNWVGSTPCCGSVAWLVENDKVTNIIIMYTGLTVESFLDFFRKTHGWKCEEGAKITPPYELFKERSKE